MNLLGPEKTNLLDDYGVFSISAAACMGAEGISDQGKSLPMQLVGMVTRLPNAHDRLRGFGFIPCQTMALRRRATLHAAMRATLKIAFLERNPPLITFDQISAGRSKDRGDSA